LASLHWLRESRAQPLIEKNSSLSRFRPIEACCNRSRLGSV
jgi:hypothetical protein